MTFFCPIVAVMRVLDRLPRFLPAHELEHHAAAEDHAERIDHVLIGVFRRGAVRGFENRVGVADVGAGRHAQPAHLRGAGIGQVIAVEIGRGHHVVLIGTQQRLLEHGIGDAILDQDLARRDFARPPRPR